MVSGGRVRRGGPSTGIRPKRDDTPKEIIAVVKPRDLKWAGKRLPANGICPFRGAWAPLCALPILLKPQLAPAHAQVTRCRQLQECFVFYQSTAHLGERCNSTRGSSRTGTAGSSHTRHVLLLTVRGGQGVTNPCSLLSPVLQFEEIQKVIWRYKTLMRMNKDLLQAERGRREASEQAKELLAQYTEEKEEEILKYNNELAQLKLRFDEAHSDVLTWVRKHEVGRGRSPRPGCVRTS